jgi:hypothetical protein
VTAEDGGYDRREPVEVRLNPEGIDIVNCLILLRKIDIA